MYDNKLNVGMMYQEDWRTDKIIDYPSQMFYPHIRPLEMMALGMDLGFF